MVFFDIFHSELCMCAFLSALKALGDRCAALCLHIKELQQVSSHVAVF